MNPWIVLLILLIGASGLGSITYGILVLFGLGWALIAGGVALVVVADLLRRGITS